MDAENTFRHLATSILDDRWLPICMSFLQFLEQTAREAVLGQSRSELVVPLELLSLLRRHISLEERLARIIALGAGNGRKKKRRSDQNRTQFRHAVTKPKNNRTAIACNAKEEHAG